MGCCAYFYPITIRRPQGVEGKSEAPSGYRSQDHPEARVFQKQGAIMFISISRKGLAGLLALSLCAVAPFALPTGFTYKVIFEKADMVSTCVLPDGRIIVVEKSGKLTLINQKTGTKTVAIDLTSKTWNQYEGGMMCVLADPDFAKNGYLYVQYCKKGAVGGEDHDWVDRFKMTGDVIDPSSAFKILDEGFRGPNYHHGGGMAISPKDGMLYIAVGSRRGTNNQNQPQEAGKTSSVLGKICRVKIPSGEIPSDNPFFSANTGDAKAVYYYGIRNPFTLAFHPTSGKLWWTDVRDDHGDDEKAEGAAPGTGYGFGGGKEQGLFSANDVGGCDGGAMVGSLWYTGANFPAEYKDQHFFGNVRNCGSNLVYTDAGHGKFTKFGPFNVGNNGYSPIDVKMDAGGALYVSTRYQTENTKATAGQVIKVWYGDTEPVVSINKESLARDVLARHLKWTRVPGGLSVEATQDGAQTVSLQTLDGKTLAERSVSGKGSVRFDVVAKGIHVLTWKSESLRGATKVVF
jgi:glucose/arabinose dehydrogenase